MGVQQESVRPAELPTYLSHFGVDAKSKVMAKQIRGHFTQNMHLTCIGKRELGGPRK